MAFRYDSTQYVRFTDGGVSSHPTEYTLSAWVKIPSLNNGSFIVRSNGTPAAAWSHQLRMNSGAFQHYTYDGTTRSVLALFNMRFNVWYHLAATAKNSGYVRLFVNGEEAGTAVGPIGTLWAAGSDFWIGSGSGGGATNLIGDVVDLCIWYKELDRDEIRTIASKVRFSPLQVQRQHIRLYLPMNDRPDTTPISFNYIDLSSYNNTQTRTNNPLCVADEIAYQ